MNLPLTISRTIFRSYQLELKISTKIILTNRDQKTSRLYVRDFVSVDGKRYRIVDHGDPVLRLQYLPKGQEEDRDRSMDMTLTITDRDMLYLRSGLHELYDRMCTNCYGVRVEGKREVLCLLDPNQEAMFLRSFHYSDQRLAMKPDLIYDMEENPVSEAAMLWINRPDYNALLSLRELEALIYHLDHADLFLYSQMLYNQFAITQPQLEAWERSVPKYFETLRDRTEEAKRKQSSVFSVGALPKKTEDMGLGKPSSSL